MYIKNNFPDQEHLKNLVDHQIEVIKKDLSLEAQLAMCSGALLNWKFDFLSDKNTKWSEPQELQIDDLTLTGVNPIWNEYTIKQAERSPKKFRKLLEENSDIKDKLKAAKFIDIPILVRIQDEKLMLLDGMKRTVGAIFEGRKTIRAYIATSNDSPKPQCELHVIYDILRAYNRGINKDLEGLKATLKFLNHTYSNVEMALKERFNGEWENNPKLQAVITEVLEENK